MSPEQAETALIVLQKRDGLLTEVTLAEGPTITVHSIAWGRDLGAQFHHVTSNCSPVVDDVELHLFHTNEIRRIVDPSTGQVVWPPGEEL